MSSEVKKLKKSFSKAILWLLFLLVVATGSTFAWFSLAGRSSTNVTPVGGTISEGDAELLISAKHGGPFDKTCDLALDANPDALQPVTTSDLAHFYQPTAQNKEGISILYASADDKIKEKLMHGTVYLQCKNASCDVYFDPKELSLGSDGQALAAMRLGMKLTSQSGTQTFIWKLDDLGGTASAQSVKTIAADQAVVAAIGSGGQPSYVKDPAQGIGAYMAKSTGGTDAFQAGSQKLVQLKADEVATVEYWLYLEGCD